MLFRSSTGTDVKKEVSLPQTRKPTSPKAKESPEERERKIAQQEAEEDEEERKKRIQKRNEEKKQFYQDDLDEDSPLLPQRDPEDEECSCVVM